MTHSPLPWKHEKKDGIQCISDADGNLLFCDEPYDSWCSSEDMPFVVKAVNSHEVMLDYLKIIAARSYPWESHTPESITECFNRIHELAKEAIAKAEEE